jgi:hypothetical protein
VCVGFAQTQLQVQKAVTTVGRLPKMAAHVVLVQNQRERAAAMQNKLQLFLILLYFTFFPSVSIAGCNQIIIEYKAALENGNLKEAAMHVGTLMEMEWVDNIVKKTQPNIKRDDACEEQSLNSNYSKIIFNDAITWAEKNKKPKLLFNLAERLKGDYQKIYYKDLITRAAELGDDEAQYKLARMYLFGIFGLQKNSFKSIELFKSSVSKNNADAAVQLGLLYKNGADVLQDYAEANKLFQFGASLGDWSAMVEIADNYFDGIGLIRDFSKSYMWFNLALDKATKENFDTKYIRERRDLSAMNLKNDDILKAQELSKKCLQSNYKNCD